MAKFDPSTLPFYDPAVDRRVCFITGGNSGIGYYTVLHLYLHGFTVYVAGRSESRVSDAITAIKSEAVIRRSKIPELKYAKLGALKYIYLDLLDLSTVETAVKEFESQEQKLDILINNAGIMSVPYAITKDNFEVQLQVNYVAHFLLTDRLLKFMNHNPSENSPVSRIINLSSIAHNGVFYEPSLKSSRINFWPYLLSSSYRYAIAKLSNCQFSIGLAKRNPEILNLSVHPGIVMNTNLFSPLTRLPFIGAVTWIMLQIIGYFAGVTNEEGCYSTLKCALSEDLSLEKDNGKYFVTFGNEASASRLVKNEKCCEETWAWTVQGLSDCGFKLEH